MGGLVSSLFDLFSGNPTQKEQDAFGGLAGYETGLGESLTSAGANEELSLLSGDPTKIAQVEAPEITAQRKQIEQQNLQNANFGTRSGGTAASTQAADAAGRTNIFDLTGGLIGSTAGSAVGQGSSLLSQAPSNLGSEAGLAEQRRQQLNSDVGNVAQSAALGPGPMAEQATDNPLSSTMEEQLLQTFF